MSSVATAAINPSMPSASDKMSSQLLDTSTIVARPFNVQSLAILPEAVLSNIASHSDELAIWRMMATSRAFRHAAEPALKPYLRKRVIAPFPVQSEDVDGISCLVLSSRAVLRETAVKFGNHLAAYPLSRSLVRDLTIEVREDDAKSGWALLAGLANQLESLDIHVYHGDGTYESDNGSIDMDEGEGEDESEDGESDVGSKQGVRHIHDMDVDDDEDDVGHDYLQHGEEDNYRWRSCWPAKITESSILFANLTTLRLESTTHSIEFLPLLLASPLLRDLALICHCQDPEFYQYPQYDSDLQPLVKLERLSITGLESVTGDLADIFLSYAHNIRFLSLDIPDPNSDQGDREPWSRRCEDEMVAINEYQGKLEGLALYGSSSYGYLRSLKTFQGVRQKDGGHDSVKLLIVEQDGWEEKTRGLYSFLIDKAEYRPFLPSLSYLTFVDKRLDALGHFLVEPSDNSLLFTPSYEIGIRSLFDHYPTLQQISWYKDYPIDPFVAGAPVDEEPHFVCSYIRPEEEGAVMERRGLGSGAVA